MPPRGPPGRCPGPRRGPCPVGLISMATVPGRPVLASICLLMAPAATCPSAMTKVMAATAAPTPTRESMTRTFPMRSCAQASMIAPRKAVRTRVMRPPPWRVQPLARRRPVRSRWCLPPRLDGAQPGPDGPRPRRGGLGELLEAARLAPLDLDRGEHAVAEPVGALRARGDGEVMGDDDERGAVLVALALQKVHHQGASVDVESAGGLVGEDDPGPPGKRPGDGDELLLAAGEPLDGRADPVAQPDGLQELLGALHPGPEGLPRVIEERGAATFSVVLRPGMRLKDWKT